MLNYEEINPYYDKVTLIGMMGTGKSKFGRQISNILKFNFYDIDHMIEKEFNMTIKEFINRPSKKIVINIKWVGTCINEKGIDTKNKKIIIECKKRYFRPLEVDYLRGNARKAKKY